MNRCYLCGQFMAKDSEHEECSACRERMAGEYQEWFDGFKLADWLKEQGWEQRDIEAAAGPLLTRTYRFWLEGRAGSLQQVDALLTALGYHLSDLPPDFKHPGPPKQAKQHPQDVRNKVFALTRKGWTPAQIKRHMGFDGPGVQTINYWLRTGGISKHTAFKSVWEGVDRRGEAECWPWTGSVYGKSDRSTRAGKPSWRGAFVHRIIARELWNVTSKETIRLTCENKICCNPRHMEVRKQGSWQQFRIWGANSTATKTVTP